MACVRKSPAGPRPIETLVHADSRRNIPTAEFQSIAQQMDEVKPFEPARYRRAAPLTKGETRERSADLDPQIIWRGVRITLSQAQRPANCRRPARSNWAMPSWSGEERIRRTGPIS